MFYNMFQDQGFSLKTTKMKLKLQTIYTQVVYICHFAYIIIIINDLGQAKGIQCGPTSC